MTRDSLWLFDNVFGEETVGNRSAVCVLFRRCCIVPYALSVAVRSFVVSLACDDDDAGVQIELVDRGLAGRRVWDG